MVQQAPTDALAARALELLGIPSVSGDESQLADYLREVIALPRLFDDGDSIVFGRLTGRPILLLAGHMDTVPPQGNLRARLTRDTLWGLGASDMKGALAVMAELANAEAGSAPGALDLVVLFFPREELGGVDNPLPALISKLPFLSDVGLAICLEPTANTLQLGCLGSLTARVAITGRAAHSARPWLGINAFDRAVEELAPVIGRPPRDVDVDGLAFREVISVTQFSTGVAANVIPAYAEAIVNFRYAPTTTPAQAERLLSKLLPSASVIVNAPPATVNRDHLLIRHLQDLGQLPVEPKQAWTNVADFSAHDIPAVNFGPGDPRFAHTADEQVALSALAVCHDLLSRLLIDG